MARKFGVERIDRATLESFGADMHAHDSTFSTCAIRPNTRPGHFPDAISAPGGQLVQATDMYAGTLGARIVLSDDKEVRALMTASWLKQMGWKDVYVLAEAGNETGTTMPKVLGAAPADAAIDALELSDISSDVTVIDLSRSPDYRRGHIPGAWFAIRSRLDRALRKIEHAAARGPDLRGRRAGGPRGRGGARA